MQQQTTICMVYTMKHCFIVVVQTFRITDYVPDGIIYPTLYLYQLLLASYLIIKGTSYNTLFLDMYCLLFAVGLGLQIRIYECTFVHIFICMYHVRVQQQHLVVSGIMYPMPGTAAHTVVGIDFTKQHKSICIVKKKRLNHFQ